MYSIIEINGGIGKSIMATAVVSGIKKKYPEREVLVITAYPEVFLNNPEVSKVFKFGNCPYFHRDYVKDKDVKFFCDEPYRTSAYLRQEKHLIQAWGDVLGVECLIEPRLYLNPLEESTVLNRMTLQKPLLVFQPFGGAIEQKEQYSWNRDIPPRQAQEIATYLSQHFHVVQPVNDRQIKLENCEHVSLPLREMFVLIKHAHSVVGIDSFVQHARKALGGISTVCWVTNAPLVFGYLENNNVLPQQDKVVTNIDLDGYFQEYDFSGSRTYDYPFVDDNVFNLDEVLSNIYVYIMGQEKKKTFINDAFDDIYLINMDKRVDRLEKMTTLFQQNDINNYKRIEGVEITDELFETIDEKEYANFKLNTVTSEELLSKYIKGALGCRESHVNCIRDAKKNGHKIIMVMEDDLVFADNINVRLSDVFEQIKTQEWDMLYLGGDYWDDGKIYQTCGYIIKSNVFDYILDNYTTNGEEMDFFYVNEIQSKFKVLKITPPLVEQNKLDSDIPTMYVK